MVYLLLVLRDIVGHPFLLYGMDVVIQQLHGNACVTNRKKYLMVDLLESVMKTGLLVLELLKLL